MRKTHLFMILLVMAVSVACARQTDLGRQMSSGGYGLQSGGSSENRWNLQYGGSAPISERDSLPADGLDKQEYGGSAGSQTNTRSAHGFDRGSRTQRWSVSPRQTGPAYGMDTGDMSHGLASPLTPPFIGGSGVGGTGQ